MIYRSYEFALPLFNRKNTFLLVQASFGSLLLCNAEIF